MLEFHNIRFTIEEQKIKIADFGCLTGLNSGFAEVQIAGENKNTHLGAKMIRSSESDRLTYVSHRIAGNTLTVVQESPFVQVQSDFTVYDDTNTIRVRTTVTNISSSPVILEEVSAFCITGFGDNPFPAKPPRRMSTKRAEFL